MVLPDTTDLTALQIAAVGIGLALALLALSYVAAWVWQSVRG